MKISPRFIHIGLLFGSALLQANAANGTWTNLITGGLWNATGNWSSSVIADGSGSTADFSTLDIDADNTVHLNTARTIGNLTFGDADGTTAAAWLLDNNGTGTNILTLAGGTPTITVGTLGTDKNTTITAVVAGSSGLTKDGAGMLVLNAANTYSGGTTVNAGILAISNAAALGGPGNVTLGNNTTLRVNYISATPTLTGVNTLSVASGRSALLDLIGSGVANNTLTLATGAITLDGTLRITRSAGANGSTNLNAPFTGAGTLEIGNTQAGSTVVATSGLQGRFNNPNANAYAGFTGSFHVLADGNLCLFNGTLLSANNNNVTIDAGGYLSLLAGSTPFIAALNGGGTITKNSVATLTTLNVASGDFSGVISGSALQGIDPIALTKTGAGTLTLSGVNTYTGATTISGGTLEIGGAGKLGNGSYAGAISNASTLRFNGTASQVLSGALSGAGALVKDNSGTVSLGGTNINTGTFTVNGGNLVFAKLTALYNNTPASWTPVNLIANSGGTIGFNVGGTGEFTSANLDTLRAVASGSGGFLGGSLFGIDTTNAGSNFTYASNVSNPNGGANAVGLNKLGTGTLTLTGTNTYTGVTKVSGGTALFPTKVALYNNTPASWTATNLVVNSGATLAVNVGGAGEFTSADLDTLKSLGTASGGFLGGSSLGIDTTNAGGTFTYASNITDTNGQANPLGLTKLGTGTLILTGALSYTGPTAVLGGSIEYGGSSDKILAGAMSGAGGLTKSGTGKLTLTGANTYTGDTNILGGTLEIGDPGKLGNGNYAGNIANAGIFLINTTAAQTLSGVISGAGSLVKSNTGTATLTGLNTYTGTTTITGGILSINSIKTVNGGASALGAVTTVSAGTINLGFDDITGTLKYTGTGDTTDRVINLAGTTGGGTLDQSGSGLLTLTSNLTATGAGSKTLTLTGTGTGLLSGVIPNNSPDNLTNVQKSGTGTWILSGANTYTGWTTISGGTLQLKSPSTIAGAAYSSILVDGSGSTLMVNAGGAGAWTQADIDSLLLAPAYFSFGTTLGIDTSGGNFSFNPVNHFGDLNFIKAGLNTLTLTTAVLYTGSTTINGGTLVVSANESLPAAAPVILNSTGSGSTPASLNLGNFNQTTGGLTISNTNATNADTISIAAGKTLTVNGAVSIGRNADASTTLATISGAGALTVNNSGGTFQVGGANSGNNDNAATLDMGGLSTFTADLGAAGTFRVGDVTAAVEGGIGASTAILGKTSTLTAGTLDLGGTTSHAIVQTLKLGDTVNTINASTINVGSAPVGQRASGAIQFNTASGTLKIRSATDPVAGRADLNMVNTNQATGAVLSASVDLLGHSSDVRLGTLTMAVRTGNSSSGSNGNFSFDAGTLDVSSIVLATRTGTGTATSTGVLNIGGGTANIGGISMANATGTHTADATINLTGGTTTLGGNITRTGTTATSIATINLDGGTLDMGGFAIGAASAVTLNAKSGTLRNLGQLNNGGVLTKSTGGTLVLASASTYSGGTSINAGTLLANNTTGSAAGTGSVTVKTTATFGGTGAVSGAVILESGGKLAPGTSIGTLATGALTVPAGATLTAEINSSGSPTGDRVNVTGGLTLGGALTVTDIAGAPAVITPGTKLTLISYSGGLTGTFTGKAEASTFSVGSNTFKIRYADGGAVTLEALSAGAGYSTWASSNAPSQTAGQDYDKDGVTNGVEYVLGGLATTNDAGKLPTVSTASGNFIFSFVRNQASKTVDTAVSIQVGTTLAAWPSTYVVGNTTGTSTAGVIVTDNLNGTDTVTLTVPQAPDAKKFARLNVVITP